MPRAKLWTEDENAILNREYPWRGPEGCQKFLPGRTVKAITQHACKLGLRLPNRSIPTGRPKKNSDSFEAPKRGPIFPIPEDTRDFTSKFFGDPMPGRSALDKKLAVGALSCR